jgi:hypothetical protein
MAQVELHPHAIAFSTHHARANWRLFVVSDQEPIAGLRVECGVVGSWAVADPRFDDEIRPMSLAW